MKKLVTALAGLTALQAGLVVADDKFETFTIKQATGKSEIKASGDSSFKPAKEGDTQKAGAVGKTGSGSDSIIKVAFDAQNTFRILPNSQVTISTSTKDPKYRKVVDLTMDKGKVDVKLDEFPQKYSLQVQTPTAVCGAVGTQFVVDADSATASSFKVSKGSIFAQSLDDESFTAPSIKAGQTLKAEAAPGKQNSYTKLNADGGNVDVHVGSREGKTIEVAENSTVQLAQEHGDSKQVAMVVSKGDSKKAYVVDGEDLDAADKIENGPALVKDYVAAAETEGKLKSKLEKARQDSSKESEVEALEKKLDAAAEEATRKRKALFEARGVMRDAFRSGASIDRGAGRQAPATGPRGGGGSSSSY